MEKRFGFSNQQEAGQEAGAEPTAFHQGSYEKYTGQFVSIEAGSTWGLGVLKGVHSTHSGTRFLLNPYYLTDQANAQPTDLIIDIPSNCPHAFRILPGTLEEMVKSHNEFVQKRDSAKENNQPAQNNHSR